MSDFSLMDAIESGIVKIPRVPVSDDQVGGLLPVYRDLYRHIRDELPKKGRAKQKHESLDPDDLPEELLGALNALYGHYTKVFDEWDGQQGRPRAGLHRGLQQHQHLQAGLRLHRRLRARGERPDRS